MYSDVVVPRHTPPYSAGSAVLPQKVGVARSTVLLHIHCRARAQYSAQHLNVRIPGAGDFVVHEEPSLRAL